MLQCGGTNNEPSVQLFVVLAGNVFEAGLVLLPVRKPTPEFSIR